jgi:hypothetical protein
MKERIIEGADGRRIVVIDGGHKIANDDPIHKAREDLDFARNLVAGAYRARELGDLLPSNGPAKTAARILAAHRGLEAAEAAWTRLTGEPLPPHGVPVPII